jgi:hypothetical protein
MLRYNGAGGTSATFGINATVIVLSNLVFDDFLPSNTSPTLGQFNFPSAGRYRIKLQIECERLVNNSNGLEDNFTLSASNVSGSNIDLTKTSSKYYRIHPNASFFNMDIEDVWDINQAGVVQFTVQQLSFGSGNGTWRHVRNQYSNWIIIEKI